jgi:hypothetical protein
MNPVNAVAESEDRFVQVAETAEVQKGVGPVAIERDDLELSTKVSRV